MVLRRELQQLAAALKATQEYARMTGLRQKLMGDPSLGRQMTGFEKEHIRILNLGLPETEAAARLKQLYAEYAGFLEKQDVKDYVKATQEYQAMVAENISFLNSLLDARNSGR